MVVLVLKEGSTWVRKGTKAVQSVSWAAFDLNDKHNIWSFTKISGTEHLLCFYLVSHIHGDLQPLRTLTILWQNQHHLLSSFTNHHLQIKSSLHQTSPPSNLPSIKSPLFETFLSIVPFCGVGFAIPLRIFHSTIPPKSSILPTLRPHHPCPP